MFCLTVIGLRVNVFKTFKGLKFVISSFRYKEIIININISISAAESKRGKNYFC